MGLTFKSEKDIIQYDLEQRLQRAMESRRKAMARWDKTIAELTALVTPNCTHSLTEAYHWEHDNGYGQQKKMKGLVCLLCHAKRLWGGDMGTWVKAKDLSYD